MFDYVIAEQNLPYAQCPKCNMKVKFHGGWFPEVAICSNCGEILKVRNSLSEDSFSNLKYDKDGKIIRE